MENVNAKEGNDTMNTNIITTDTGIEVELREDGWYAINHVMAPHPYGMGHGENFVAHKGADDEQAGNAAEKLCLRPQPEVVAELAALKQAAYDALLRLDAFVYNDEDIEANLNLLTTANDALNAVLDDLPGDYIKR
jgi:hypothetical protein